MPKFQINGDTAEQLMIDYLSHEATHLQRYIKSSVKEAANLDEDFKYVDVRDQFEVLTAMKRLIEYYTIEEDTRRVEWPD